MPCVRVSTLEVVGRCEGTPFFGAKGRIIDRPLLLRLLLVRSLAQMVITYLPQSGAAVDTACDSV